MKQSAILFVALLSAASAFAQNTDTGKGQGAIVIKEGAVLYKKSTGDEAYPPKFGGSSAVVSKGDAVVGITTLLLGGDSYSFAEADGRVHVLTLDLRTESRRGIVVDGWMDPADLSPVFTYECGCGPAKSRCSPLGNASFVRFKWNVCFDEARRAKLAALQATPPAQPSPSSGSSESVETRLQKLNELYKKGLITKEEYEQKRAEILKSM